MAMSPQQIAQAVNYFTQRGAARQQLITNWQSTPSVSETTASRAAFGGTSAPRSGGGGGGGAAGIASIAPDAQKRAQVQKRVQQEGLVNGVVRAVIDGAAGTSSRLNGGGALSDAVLEDMGTTEAPQNPVQWLMNALSTGTYVGANAANAIGQNAAKFNKEIEPLAKKGDSLGVVGKQLESAATGTVEAIRGVGRGLAEGAGFRFDGARPRTHGQNLEDLGVYDGLDKNNGAQMFGQGLISTAADIAGDPLSYVAGTGVVRGIRYAGGGVKDAATAGEGLGGVARAAVNGFGAGRESRITQLASQAAERAAAKAARKNGVDSIPLSAARPAEQVDEIVASSVDRADSAIPASGAGSRVADEPIAEITPAAVENPVQNVAAQIEAPRPASLVDDVTPDARLGEIAELTPALRTKARPIPVDQAGRILDNAAQPAPGAAAQISTELADTVRGVLGATRVPEVAAGLKTLRADPMMKSLLTRKVIVGGQARNIGDVLERAAMTRITGGSAGGTEAMQVAQKWLQAVTSVPRVATPGTLEAAATAEGLQGGVDFGALFGALAQAPKARRGPILASALGDAPRGFSDFGRALESAIEGDVEVGYMRQMLKALEVPVPANLSERNVRALLSSRGPVEWRRIQASIPTPAEVLDDHGITDAVAKAADEVTPDEVRTAAAEDFAEQAEQLGFDPIVTDPLQLPADASLTAAAARKAITLTEKMRAEKPEDVTGLWLSPMRSAMTEALRHPMNVGRAKGGGKVEGLVGKDRGTFGLNRLREALRLETQYAISRGNIPTFGVKAKRLHLSFGQILDLLPDDTAANAFFDLKYRRSDFGEGFEDAARVEFKKGLTILPTHAATAVWVALKTGDPERVLQQLLSKGNVSRSEFLTTAAGKAKAKELADAVSDPAFLAAARQLHEAQQLAYVALSREAADAVVAPLASRIINAVATHADRSELFAAIQNSVTAAERIAPAAAENLARDLAEQRLNNGIINTLGRAGVAAIRRDRKVMAARKPKGNVAPTPDDLKQQLVEAQARYADDMAEVTDGAVDEMIANTEDPTFAIESMSMVDAALGPYAIFDKAARAFDGRTGQADVKHLQVAATSTSHHLSAEYSRGLQTWANGGRIAGETRPGIGQRLEALVGRPLERAEVNAKLASWWRALAVAANRLGSDVSTDGIREALSTGVTRNPRLGIGENVDPLDGDELEMAMELFGFINEVFAPGAGPIARTGLAASDLSRELARWGFKDGGDFGGFGLDKAATPDDMASAWRNFDIQQLDDPLELLRRYHGAISAASVVPNIGSGFSRIFGSRALGYSREQAHAMGWKKVDRATSSGEIAKYLDGEQFYDPALLKQITYMDEFLRASQAPGKMPELANIIIRPYDAVTSVLKSAATIWRPAHHVTNVLGEYAMLLVAGVNPMHTLRSVGAMRAHGMLLDADLGALARYQRALNVAPDAKNLTATGGQGRFFSSDADVTLNDGTKVRLSAAQIMQKALDEGVAVTARESKDLVGQGAMLGGRTVLDSNWEKAWSRINVVGQIDNGLGKFSAARDNITRLGHFYSALESKSFRSVDEAISFAAAKVHEYHPTIQTMSSFEQRVMRRVVYFYTWVRQAARVIIETMIERPGVITVPSKFQYNQAEANGLEPDSFGAPAGPDIRQPSYATSTLLGPTYQGGYSPWGGTGDLEEGEPNHLWGFSLSTPQLDTLQTFFGGYRVDEGLPGVLKGINQATLSSANPLIKTPIELLTDSNIDGIGKAPSENYADYFASQTGLPYALMGATGLRTKNGYSPEQQAGETSRAQLNLLLGTKFTDYTNATASDMAISEKGKQLSKILDEAGYDDEQKAYAKEIWKNYIDSLGIVGKTKPEQ